MPEWLRAALIVLAALVALYLVVIVAQIILVTLLRRQAEPTRVSIQNAQQEAARIAEQIEAIAPAIHAGPTEMPFGPLYDQARSLLKHGMARLSELREQLATLTAREIPRQPWSDAFALIPMTTEIVRRWRIRQDTQTALARLAEISAVLARIEQIQTEIAALPQRQKDTLAQLHTRVTDLAARLDAEARPKRPLVEAYTVLREIRTHLAQADELLTDAHPSQSAVMAAHPLLTQANEASQSLDAMIQAAAEERTAAEAEFDRLAERLHAFRSDIAVDERSGCARARFAASADQLTRRLSDVQALLAEGEYTSAMRALGELGQALVAQHNALAALNEERARVADLTEQTAQQLAVVEGWIAETPARFTRDVASEAAERLRALVARSRALILVEEIERMAEAHALAREAEEVFGRASRANDDFVAARARFEALMGKLSDENVASLASSAARLAAELNRTNRYYWGDVTPEAITAAVESVTTRWPTIRDQLNVIPESALREALTSLESIAASFDRAATLCAQASRALAQRDADLQQASAALNDDTMARLLTEVAQIASESPSLAEPSARIRQQVEALRAEMRTPAPDYRRIYTDAERLRQEAASFTADYRRQLQEMHDRLGAMRQRLEEAQDKLNQLFADARLDFTAQVEPVRQALREWLSGYEAAIPASLDAARDMLRAGEDIAGAAQTQLVAAVRVTKFIAEKIKPMRTTLNQANELLVLAEAGLRDMAEFGSERWGSSTLMPIREQIESARMRLDRLDRPTMQKLSPGDAQQEVLQIEAILTDLLARAAAAQSDFGQRADALRERKKQLTRALADGDALVKEKPGAAEEWQDVRRYVADLESRWTHAASYAEALEALTRAVHRAQIFVQGKSAYR